MEKYIYPAKPEMEAALLGAISLHQPILDEVSRLLKPEDFYIERNRTVFQVMLDMHQRNEPLDTVLICDELEKKGQLEAIGGPARLIDLLNATSSWTFYESYVRAIRESAGRRRLIAHAEMVAKLAIDESQDYDEALARADQSMQAVIDGQVQGGNDVRTLHELSIAEVNRLDQAAKAIEEGRPVNDNLHTGWRIERLLGGWQRTRLYIVGGRPGMGKSLWATQAAYNMAAKFGHRGLLFSLEMSAEQVHRRLLSHLMKISVNDLHEAIIEEEDWPLLLESSDTLSKVPFDIDACSTLTLRTLRAKARSYKRKHGQLDWIVVDFIQLMQAEGKHDNRAQEINSIARGLKNLAMELNCVIIAVSQLSRAVEGLADKRPTMSHLKESGGIEEAGDAVILLYRDEYYNEETDKKNILDAIVGKSRDGAPGTWSMYFRGETMTITDLEIERVEFEY